jgi:hypothetical protein
MADDPLSRYIDRVGYTSKEAERFLKNNHRPRHVRRIAKATPVYSIEAEVVRAPL